MTKDFANQKRTSRKPARRTNTKRANRSQKAPMWAWLVIGLLLASLTTLLIYLANNPIERKTPAITSVEKPKSKEKSMPKPRFDFYQILKERQVEVEDRSHEVIGAAPKNIAYYLQAGSFRNESDANRLRAQIILLNLNAHIESSTKRGKTWYRVIVGPFHSRSKMSKARSTLASEQLNPLVLKRTTQ